MNTLELKIWSWDIQNADCGKAEKKGKQVTEKKGGGVEGKQQEGRQLRKECRTGSESGRQETGRKEIDGIGGGACGRGQRMVRRSH